MECTNCSHVNSDTAKFCEECATPLIRKCASCEQQLSPTAKFCPECGTPAQSTPASLATPAPAPQPVAAPQVQKSSSPASYTPKHLAEKIIGSRSAMEGERKLVTVLFADLKGSTEMIADQDPEVAQGILDPLLKLMMEAIHYYEGTVSLVLGDGLMAIFGAPVAHEDHGVRACYAALRIQENAAKLAEEIRASHKVELNVRVGLNSGDVVVRSVSTDLRMDYSAIGHTTHLASRMEQAAEPGSILLGPSTVRLVEGYVNVRSCGLKNIKGLEEPLEVFELLGASPVQSRLQAAVARGLTAFLGRETEIDILNQALDRTSDQHGQVVALSGEAGIGKSRLIWEFLNSQDQQNSTILQASSSAYGKSTSYSPVIALLRTYFAIDDLDAPGDVARKVREQLEMLDESMGLLVPGILSILGLPHGDEAWNNLDPQAKRRRLIDGLRSLFFLESRRKLLILVIDDLHWVDEETQALLDAMVEGVPSARIVLIVGYRPEYEHDWHRKSYFREIRIAPLPTGRAEYFLDALLGNDPSLAPLKELLINRTDGNPFFMEESVRTLHEMNFIGGEAGQFKLLKAAETVRIPESAKAILSARVDRLSEKNKRVLQAAAVIGKEVPFTLLAKISELDDEDVREAIDQLQAQEFVYEASLFPELIYTFRHALVQETSYDSLLGDRRRSLHRAIVDVMEADEKVHSLEDLDQLAHHTFRGELWEKAFDYYQKAGRRALKLSAISEAEKYFETLLTTAEKLPAGDMKASRTIEAQFDLRQVMILLGNLEEAKKVLQSARTTAERIGNLLLLGLAECYLCNIYWELGEQDSAIQAGLTAQKIAVETGDSKIRDSARRYLARAYQAVGDYDMAITLFTESLPSEGDQNASHVLIRVFLCNCLTEIGRFKEALELATETVVLAEGLNNPLAHAAALSALGRTHTRMGAFDAAKVELEHAMSIASASDIELLFPFVAAPLGATYTQTGDAEKGLQLLEDAIDKSVAMNRMVDAALWRYWQGRALLRVGKIDDARKSVDRGVALSITYKERGNQAALLCLLAEIHFELGTEKLKRSLKYFEEAKALAEELDMKPTLSRCHAGLAKWHQAMDDAEQARHHQEMAKEVGGEVAVNFWLAQATPSSNTEHENS